MNGAVRLQRLPFGWQLACLSVPQVEVVESIGNLCSWVDRLPWVEIRSLDLSFLTGLPCVLFLDNQLLLVPPFLPQPISVVDFAIGGIAFELFWLFWLFALLTHK